MYSPQWNGKVYDQEYWRSDRWDPLQYGRDYDFSRPFLEQWRDLLQDVPVPALVNLNDVASDYCNCTYESKNCYLNFASDINEDTAYLYHSMKNKNCFDMLGSSKNEKCYELIDSRNCYSCEYLMLSDSCIASRYCYDCRNCQSCFGSVGLRSANYCIFNKQYPPEEYKEEIDKLELGTKAGRAKAEKEFLKLLEAYPRKFSDSRRAINSTGDHLNDVKNCKDCFDLEGPAEDSRYVIYGVMNIRSVYDAYAVGVNLENSCDVVSAGDNVENALFCSEVYGGSHSLQYCRFLNNCLNCFGCISLRSKSYCILNKQYAKEEYEKLISRIISHIDNQPYVDSRGKVHGYGEFFPPDLSPFAYNETIAQEYYPLIKEEARELGYRWRDPEPRNYPITVKFQDIPVTIADVPDSITSEIIECQHQEKCNEQCAGAFRIIKPELQLLKEIGIPLPVLCPNCRHYERLKRRNPMKLWRRRCQCAGAKSENQVYINVANHPHHDQNNRCQNGFETSYAPERPEIVYCEQCYNSEII